MILFSFSQINSNCFQSSGYLRSGYNEVLVENPVYHGHSLVFI